jgi:hypothetical protein
MIRKYGKAITNQPWLVIRFGPKEDAEVWRKTHREYFSADWKAAQGNAKKQIISQWPMDAVEGKTWWSEY